MVHDHIYNVCLVVVSFSLLSGCCRVSSALSFAQVERRLLVLGLGPVGKSVANEALLLESKGIRDGFKEIYGTVRGLHDDYDAKGVQKLLFSRENIRQILPLCTHVFITIPPQPNDSFLDAIYTDMETLLRRNSWVGFVSTTGVYGNHNGAWVTEESSLLCRENSQAARFRDAEEAWKERAAANGWNLRVFRCAGIYGPQRSALHTVYKKGYNPDWTPTANMGVTNRVHEVDIARTVVAAMIRVQSQRTCDYRVFNVCDNEPAPRHIVMQHAARLLSSRGISFNATKTDDLHVTERSRRRSADRKRVANSRMLTELLNGCDGLKYPTFREGLVSILNHPSAPWSTINTD